MCPQKMAKESTQLPQAISRYTGTGKDNLKPSFRAYAVVGGRVNEEVSESRS